MLAAAGISTVVKATGDTTPTGSVAQRDIDGQQQAGEQDGPPALSHHLERQPRASPVAEGQFDMPPAVRGRTWVSGPGGLSIEELLGRPWWAALRGQDGSLS